MLKKYTLDSVKTIQYGLQTFTGEAETTKLKEAEPAAVVRLQESDR